MKTLYFKKAIFAALAIALFAGCSNSTGGGGHGSSSAERGSVNISLPGGATGLSREITSAQEEGGADAPAGYTIETFTVTVKSAGGQTVYETQAAPGSRVVVEGLEPAVYGVYVTGLATLFNADDVLFSGSAVNITVLAGETAQATVTLRPQFKAALRFSLPDATSDQDVVDMIYSKIVDSSGQTVDEGIYRFIASVYDEFREMILDEGVYVPTGAFLQEDAEYSYQISCYNSSGAEVCKKSGSLTVEASGGTVDLGTLSATETSDRLYVEGAESFFADWPFEEQLKGGQSSLSVYKGGPATTGTQVDLADWTVSFASSSYSGCVGQIPVLVKSGSSTALVSLMAVHNADFGVGEWDSELQDYVLNVTFGFPLNLNNVPIKAGERFPIVEPTPCGRVAGDMTYLYKITRSGRYSQTPAVDASKLEWSIINSDVSATLEMKTSDNEFVNPNGEDWNSNVSLCVTDNLFNEGQMTVTTFPAAGSYNELRYRISANDVNLDDFTTAYNQGDYFNKDISANLYQVRVAYWTDDYTTKTYKTRRGDLPYIYINNSGSSAALHFECTSAGWDESYVKKLASGDISITPFFSYTNPENPNSVTPEYNIVKTTQGATLLIDVTPKEGVWGEVTAHNAMNPKKYGFLASGGINWDINQRFIQCEIYAPSN